ncbi:MAG: TIR domain-containing protein [Alphaproteobacteria bacterium]|nr:TIR domain-containing protein [Alphaproteobacteria bacterium]
MAGSTDRVVSSQIGKTQFAGTPLKVYVCYSRASDYSFASDLAAALDMLVEFDVRIDRADIHEGDDWQGRLGAQIEAAGTVIFVMSARSAISPSCRFELKEAERLSKRIIPVLAQSLGGAAAPEPVARLPYIRFDHGHSFVDGLKELRAALLEDLGWLAEHSRLYARSLEWDRARRPDNLLLMGGDVRAAKAWLDRQPAGAPLPTTLHRDFIRASDAIEAERDRADGSLADQLRGSIRRLRIVVAACVLAIAGAGGYAYYTHQQATDAALKKQRAEATWVGLSKLRKAAEQSEQRYEEAAVQILDIIFSARSTEARRALGPIVAVLLRDLSREQVQRLQDRVAEFGQFQRDKDGSFGLHTEQAVDEWVEALERLREGPGDARN